MPRLPKLNQKIQHFKTARTGDYGELSKTTEDTIRCRFSLKTGMYRDSRGQDIEYHATLHTNYIENLKKGDCMTYNNQDYMVIDVYSTPDLNGNFFMNFCYLKEYNYA